MVCCSSICGLSKLYSWAPAEAIALLLWASSIEVPSRFPAPQCWLDGCSLGMRSFYSSWLTFLKKAPSYGKLWMYLVTKPSLSKIQIKKVNSWLHHTYRMQLLIRGRLLYESKDFPLETCQANWSLITSLHWFCMQLCCLENSLCILSEPTDVKQDSPRATF